MKPRKQKHSNVLYIISILLTRIILITTDVLLMMLPIQPNILYLGNSVLLKTFMISLLSSCSFFLSFAFASWLSSVPAPSWPSRSRLSSDSTLRTNTDTSTAADKGREHTLQKLTLHFRCVVTGNIRHWSGSVAYFLSQRPSTYRFYWTPVWLEAAEWHSQPAKDKNEKKLSDNSK